MRLTFSYSKASNFDIGKFVRLITVDTVIWFPSPIIKLFLAKIISWHSNYESDVFEIYLALCTVAILLAFDYWNDALFFLLFALKEKKQRYVSAHLKSRCELNWTYILFKKGSQRRNAAKIWAAVCLLLGKT